MVQKAPQRLCIQQASHAGQLLAFHELQRSAAAGRDVGHLVGIAQLLNSGCAVAAAFDAFYDRLHAESSMNVNAEIRVFEDMLRQEGLLEDPAALQPQPRP